MPSPKTPSFHPLSSSIIQHLSSPSSISGTLHLARYINPPFGPFPTPPCCSNMTVTHTRSTCTLRFGVFRRVSTVRRETRHGLVSPLACIYALTVPLYTVIWVYIYPSYGTSIFNPMHFTCTLQPYLFAVLSLS